MLKLFHILIVVWVWLAHQVWNVVKFFRYVEWRIWKMYVRIAFIAGQTKHCANCGGVMLPSEFKLFTRDGRPVHGDGIRHFTLQDSRRVICNKAPDGEEAVGYEAAHPIVMHGVNRVPPKHFRA